MPAPPRTHPYDIQRYIHLKDAMLTILKSFSIILWENTNKICIILVQALFLFLYWRSNHNLLFFATMRMAAKIGKFEMVTLFIIYIAVGTSRPTLARFSICLNLYLFCVQLITAFLIFKYTYC